MSVYQDMWTEIKSKLDTNVAFKAFLKAPIIYTEQDADISKMPACVVGFTAPAIDDVNFALQKKKTGLIALQPKIKVKHNNSANRILKLLEGIELLFNCFDVDMSYDGKLIKIPRMQVISILTMGAATLEATTEIDFLTQPFTYGNR